MTYTARSDAGPSNTTVIPSTVTVAASLAIYLESPLMYSFPEKGRIQPLSHSIYMLVMAMRT
jgi:hypothetical protein